MVVKGVMGSVDDRNIKRKIILFVDKWSTIKLLYNINQ